MKHTILTLAVIMLVTSTFALEPLIFAAKKRPKPIINGWAKHRIEDKINRGIVAVPTKEGKVYLGWRLLKSDPKKIAFNVYRTTGSSRPKKLNAEPLVKTTDFIDGSPTPNKDNRYSVRPVINNKEQKSSEQAIIRPNRENKPYISIKLNGSHTFQKVGIADLNGDGHYDFVIKQPSANIDPWWRYWKPSPDTYKIEAYLHNGKFLWRKDLGWAIERGIWYSPYVVYDLDGDGKAEICVKTGTGDPRGPDGKVKSGPEYLSIWDGMTGKEKARVDWPSREGFPSKKKSEKKYKKSDKKYNHSSRNQIGIAYLDGRTPCLIAARGTYSIMKCDAYQYYKGELKKLWTWNNREEGARYQRGSGAHFMHSADVDSDGRDEIILGSCVIDDNGQGLWSTYLGHPDHCYVGDIDPSRPGLEIYYGIERPQAKNGVCLVDARTGKTLRCIDERTFHVHVSGLCSDFIPDQPGMECYSGEKNYPKKKPNRWLHSAKGELLADEKKWNVGLSPRAVYWDGDPQRELLIGKRIRDYMGQTHTTNIIGRHAAWADILGDWREEIITSVNGELRIYTTTIPATDRRACLMQDAIYRLDVAHLSMGYPQPPMTSFCIDKK